MTAMRNILALVIVVGFLAVVAATLFAVEIRDNPTMLMMLGTLSTAFGMVMQWHFGSSSGSERKSDLLARTPPIADPATPEKPAP